MGEYLVFAHASSTSYQNFIKNDSELNLEIASQHSVSHLGWPSSCPCSCSPFPLYVVSPTSLFCVCMCVFSGVSCVSFPSSMLLLSFTTIFMALLSQSSLCEFFRFAQLGYIYLVDYDYGLLPRRSVDTPQSINQLISRLGRVRRLERSSHLSPHGGFRLVGEYRETDRHYCSPSPSIVYLHFQIRSFHVHERHEPEQGSIIGV